MDRHCRRAGEAPNTGSGGCGRVRAAMRDVAHSAIAPPDRQTPYAHTVVAEAVFADAKAYLSSREARQMSESELERELHRRGQELMRRLLQGHHTINAARGQVAGPVEGADDVERSPQRVSKNATPDRFGTTSPARCRLRASVGRARSRRRDFAGQTQLEPRGPRPSAAVYLPPSTPASTLDVQRQGTIDIIHAAETPARAYRLEDAGVCSIAPPASSKGCAGTWSETEWSLPAHARAPGWSRGDPEASGATSQPSRFDAY